MTVLQELVFCARAGAEKFGVVSVSDIPDNGDGSETWTLEESALDTNLTITPSTFYDFAVIDSTIYLISDGGDIVPVMYDNGTWSTGATMTGGAPGGSWKSASVVDLDGDGKKEIVYGGWSSSAQNVYLLQETSQGVLTTTPIANVSPYIGSGRLYGGDSGDLDNDGNLDFVFGSRGATPDGAIFRLAYKGGDITDAANYELSRIDEGLGNGGRADLIAIGNLDSDPDMEVAYSGIPGSSLIPLTILKRVQVDNLMTIAAVKVDADTNYVPDMLDSTATVVGVVNSVNWGESSGYFSYTIQDMTAGIDVYKSGEVGPSFNVGDRIVATGTVSQFNGLVELTVADLTADITLLDTAKTIVSKTVTIADLNSNGEKYESMVVTVKGVAPSPTNTVSWPAANSNAKINIWDGHDKTDMYIDKDSELDGATEPTYPVTVTGVVSQFTTATPANGGYEVLPRFVSDFVMNVAVPPSKYFSLVTPSDSTVVELTDSAQVVTFNWQKPLDFNGDALIYQFKFLPSVLTKAPSDTTIDLTATDILKLMTGDTLTVTWTIVTKGAEADLVASVDTFMVTFINNISTVGVTDKQIPTRFYVDQNYPNPFNPATTIKFGLAKDQVVDLRVYNVLGQQVAVLINNQSRPAGSYNLQFNAANLASGTYIYRLTAGNNVVTKKMVLLK